VGKYKDKITIGMIYQEYSEYSTPKYQGGLNKNKLDLIFVKKAFEELASSNIITIKNDEKYVNIYELKLPMETTKDIILELNKENHIKFDSEMLTLINANFK
jgi:hypothetical protein